MSRFLYLSDDLLSAIRLPEVMTPPGEARPGVWSLDGMKAEPLVDLHTGVVTGHEFLSLLPPGVCTETFFRRQPATAMAELFLLQLMLSDGLTPGLRFFNLPVRVLTSRSLCEVLYARSLERVVVEIQDPETFPGLTPLQRECLRRNLHGFRQAGAAIYADDITPALLPLLADMSLPLSGLKISRHEFQTRCGDIRFLQELNEEQLLRSGPGFCFVAEGIETPAQSLLAALAGFTHGQGGLWAAERWLFAACPLDGRHGKTGSLYNGC